MVNPFQTAVRTRVIAAARTVAAVLFMSCVLMARPAVAQTATAVPKLDLQQYLTAWYVQAWLPTKAQKRCATNVTTLYAAGNGLGTFQVGTFCQRKDGNTDEWDGTGKVDKTGGGKFKLRRLFILSSPYWVISVAPDYQWALVGTPNHKQLWILSKAATLQPEVLADIEGKASAQGFDISKLSRTTPNPAAF